MSREWTWDRTAPGQVPQDILMSEILHPESQAPNGVKFHMIDIYLDELSKVGRKGGAVRHPAVCVLLQTRISGAIDLSAELLPRQRKIAILKKRRKMKEMSNQVHSGVLSPKSSSPQALQKGVGLGPVKKKKMKTENGFVQFTPPSYQSPCSSEKPSAGLSSSQPCPCRCQISGLEVGELSIRIPCAGIPVSHRNLGQPCCVAQWSWPQPWVTGGLLGLQGSVDGLVPLGCGFVFQGPRQTGVGPTCPEASSKEEVLPLHPACSAVESVTVRP
ncbi:Ribosomal Rna Processing Protein 1-like B [Manis pentadactyla]|nr:Ribosomal Rna Processing Protein 1-like B [Manis pentadactyla]